MCVLLEISLVITWYDNKDIQLYDDVYSANNKNDDDGDDNNKKNDDDNNN